MCLLRYMFFRRTLCHWGVGSTWIVSSVQRLEVTDAGWQVSLLLWCHNSIIRALKHREVDLFSVHHIVFPSIKNQKHLMTFCVKCYINLVTLVNNILQNHNVCLVFFMAKSFNEYISRLLENEYGTPEERLCGDVFTLNCDVTMHESIVS